VLSMNVKPTSNMKKVEHHHPFTWDHSRPKGRSREQGARPLLRRLADTPHRAVYTLDNPWTRARCDECDSVVRSRFPIYECINDAVLFDVPSHAVESLFCTRELDQDVQTVPTETSRAPTTATLAA